MKTNSQPPMKNRGFTLIELLVVISIIGVLAAFTIPVIGQLKLAQYKKVARAELEAIQTALENYKAKYGAYPPANTKPPGTYTAPITNSMLPQLFYELSGTVFKSSVSGDYYETLDGSAQIGSGSVPVAYGVGGFINCTKGGGDDASAAKNFLVSISSRQKSTVTNNTVFPTTILITSIGGPDANYLPLGAQDLNPIRYRYPGVNNPNGYDLWIKFQFKNKTYLICNWNRQTIVNSPLP